MDNGYEEHGPDNPRQQLRHGDLRHMIVDGEKRLLIDFDYGGKRGEARYTDEPLLPILRKDDRVAQSPSNRMSALWRTR